MQTAPLTLFGNVPVSERTPIIELKSVYGLSALRDVQTEEGSGTVTHSGAGQDAEFVLTTTASGADRAVLDTAERGRYQPGTSAEAGIGVRLGSGTLTGSQVARWGYFDDDNGYFFGLDADGLFVGIRRAGSDSLIREEHWNAKGQPEGLRGRELDVTDGGIWQINFAWYGYGAIQFEVVQGDADGVQRVHVLHRHEPTRQTSTRDPNLPIRAEIDNGGTAEAQSLRVAGRQFSVLGRWAPNRRINGHYRLGLGSIGETFLPVISFRRKDAFESVSVKLDGVDIIGDTNMLWQLRVGGSLTGASFGAPNDTTAAETACEVDTSATAITGGELLYGGIAPASSNIVKTLGGEGGLAFDVPGVDAVSLCVRAFSGTTGTVSGAVLRWREEW